MPQVGGNIAVIRSIAVQPCPVAAKLADRFTTCHVTLHYMNVNHYDCRQGPGSPWGGGWIAVLHLAWMSHGNGKANSLLSTLAPAVAPLPESTQQEP
jgi:hypothetical protein